MTKMPSGLQSTYAPSRPFVVPPGGATPPSLDSGQGHCRRTNHEIYPQPLHPAGLDNTSGPRRHHCVYVGSTAAKCDTGVLWMYSSIFADLNCCTAVLRPWLKIAPAPTPPSTAQGKSGGCVRVENARVQRFLGNYIGNN